MPLLLGSGILALLLVTPSMAFAAGGPDGTLTVAGGAAVTGSRSVAVSASVTGAGSGREYRLADGEPAGDWLAWTGGDTLETAVVLAEGDGPHTVVLEVRDSAGEARLTDGIVLDTVAPAVSLRLEDGAPSTRDRRVGVAVTAADAGPGDLAMRLSPDGGATFGDWRPLDPATQIGLPEGTTAGPVTVVAEVRDAAGNVGRGEGTVRFAPPEFRTLDLDLRYTLDADLSYARGTLDVRETIALVNRSGRLVTSLDLYLMPHAFGELRGGVTVRAAGRRLAARWTNNANLRVRLPAPLAPGEGTTIALGFGLRASSSLASSLHARLARAGGIMNVGHWFATVNTGAGTRYPGDALVSPAAERISVTIHHARGLVIAAPGRLVESSPTSGTWVHGPARDFAFAASPSFRRVTGSVDGVRVEVYTLGGGSAALASARRAIDVYGGALGRYPWPRLVIAQSPLSWHGTEYSGFVMAGSSTLVSRLAIAHEVAHQWFQGMVGNDQFRAPWVDEGAAEFLSRLFFGSRGGYCSSREIDASIYAFPAIQMPLTASACGSYYQTVYMRAQSMYWDLLGQMGRTRLLGALRDTVADHRFGILTTAELRAELARHGASRAILDRYLGD